MEKLFVPIYINSINSETRIAFTKYLKDVKADGVFLALDRVGFYCEKDEREILFKEIADNFRFFENEGYEVGCWISTFGFGTPLSEKQKKYLEGQPHITSVTGRVAGDAFCPEGEGFTERCVEYLKDIAKLIKPVRIMLDDEMCLSVRPGLGCFCEKHLELYAKEFGENLSRERLKELIFTGYNEKYRKGYMKVVGNSMRAFCRKMRDGLNEVNPKIRMGFCAGYTSWDIEGATALELTEILAGNTKPFIRFSGAPYWVSKTVNRFNNGQTLHEIIDFVRLQESACRGKEIEIMHECDSHPRPCTTVSSSLCECYDVALRTVDGMESFKYMFCYDAEPDYETGYIKRHIKNQPIYGFIDRHFTGKKEKGVFVADKLRTFENAVFPENFESEVKIMANFPISAYTMQINSIPTKYEDDGECSVVFGENARYLDKMPKKIICDLKAIEILTEKGIDAGIKSFGEKENVYSEQFKDKQPLGLFRPAVCKKCTLDSCAKIDSIFIDGTGNKYPLSYRYFNGATEFLAFTFDSYSMLRSSLAFYSYERRNQLQEFINGDYPIIKGESGIYTVVKEDEKETAVLFENITEDELSDFRIELNGDYVSAEFINVEGEINGREIKFTSTIPPYGIFALALKKRT